VASKSWWRWHLLIDRLTSLPSGARRGRAVASKRSWSSASMLDPLCAASLGIQRVSDEPKLRLCWWWVRRIVALQEGQELKERQQASTKWGGLERIPDLQPASTNNSQQTPGPRSPNGHRRGSQTLTVGYYYHTSRQDPAVISLVPWSRRASSPAAGRGTGPSGGLRRLFLTEHRLRSY
jgi:hypothetical protein